MSTTLSVRRPDTHVRDLRPAQSSAAGGVAAYVHAAISSAGVARHLRVPFSIIAAFPRCVGMTGPGLFSRGHRPADAGDPTCAHGFPTTSCGSTTTLWSHSAQYQDVGVERG